MIAWVIMVLNLSEREIWAVRDGIKAAIHFF